MYDIIGDIHGHADELRNLLKLLGYSRRNGYYQHPERRVLFLGDFIDRGPKIREVLEIVRPMIESGAALAVMGNHEFNAIAYHTSHPDDSSLFLREHSKKNVAQHFETVSQLTPSELYDYVEWFRTLPLFLEFEHGFRAVHAVWDSASIKLLSAILKEEGFSSEFLTRACSEEDKLYDAIECVLKGKEIDLPKGLEFSDKDGHSRKEIRVQWWAVPQGTTYRNYCFPYAEDVSNEPIPAQLLEGAAAYAADEIPVFFGHYWLTGERPQTLSSNVCCLDYSVAKDGFLCAYRWDGEKELGGGKFVTTKD